MASPILVPSLARLRADVNVIAPNRDKSSDGWIGDSAHKARKSAHNADDTTGSLAESSDADNKPEVRGLDIDADLRDSGQPPVTMDDIVAAILKAPTDRARLLYIIWKKRIWSKSSGWQRRDYSGQNDHTQHAHFSGDPAYDDVTTPWASVLNLQRKGLFEMLTEEEQEEMLTKVRDLHHATFKNDPGGPERPEGSLAAKVEETRNGVRELLERSASEEIPPPA